MGEESKAEEIYQYAIDNLSNKITLLKNYRILLSQQKRFSEAEKLSLRIAAIDDINPFNLFHAARNSYEAGHYKESINLYKKAIKGAPHIHEFYLGLALSYYQSGYLKKAEETFQLAIERAYKRKTRTHYQAKLMALKGQKN